MILVIKTWDGLAQPRFGRQPKERQDVETYDHGKRLLPFTSPLSAITTILWQGT